MCSEGIEVVPPAWRSRHQCIVCQGARSDAGTQTCSACEIAARALGSTAPVAALSLYRRPSRLRDLLSTYKPGRDAFDPQAAAALGLLTAVTLSTRGRALQQRLGLWDAVQVVPSTRAAGGGDHLAQVFACAGMQSAKLLRWSGRSLDHREFVADAFDAVSGQRRMSVLLLEDAYVSGSRAQSAAASLRRAGHEVAGVLTIGRRVNPDFDDMSRRYWAESEALNGPARDRATRPAVPLGAARGVPSVGSTGSARTLTLSPAESEAARGTTRSHAWPA
jgi:hypothetical protein